MKTRAGLARYRVKVHDPVRGVITRQRHISTLLPKSRSEQARRAEDRQRPA